ncbi:MAG: hypothetical protein M0Q41_01020 [Bacteroidales bacterium]|nr:hypothetical protein [Bacteroidales bacterium]
MTRTLINLTLLTTLILTGCVSQRVSTIVGCDYDKSKNQTNYFVLPFGSVSIPGKWEKANYNYVSGQQFFINNDSIRIAIAFNRFDKYEFNAGDLKKGYDFVNAFYEWDSKFFVDSYGLQRNSIENDSINNYILNQIYGFINDAKVDTYFLVGEKNGIVNNFSIMTTDKWAENKKVDFLKGLYIKD